jgi:peptide/nickel transport system permease protein
MGMIPVLLGVTILVFLMVRLIPGDPISMMMGKVSDPVVLEALRERYGLDRPPVVQYFEWLGGILRGDLGYSISNGEPVRARIAERLPRTLYLLAGAISVALVVSVPGGIAAAAKHNTWADMSITTATLVLMSLPRFWVGILLILVFAVATGLLPATGFAYPREGLVEFVSYLVMPSLALGTAQAALIIRVLRSNMLDTLRQDYITLARAKGAWESRVLFIHALRNAAIPVITIAALEVGYMLGGSIVVERVFAYPGMGYLLLTAINLRDYPLIQGIILTFALLFLFVNLLTDLLYSVIDPRIRYS